MRRTASNEAGAKELRKVKICRQNAEFPAQGQRKRAKRGKTASVPRSPHDFVYSSCWWRSAALHCNSQNRSRLAMNFRMGTERGQPCPRSVRCGFADSASVASLQC
jgi:hypothetical protein